MLNKVICCSADGLKLVRVAATLTQSALVLSYPRATWPLQAAMAVQHFVFRALGRKYRFFVRPAADIERVATAAGLVRSSGWRGLVWEHATFIRP